MSALFCILLVDDDPSSLESTQRILEHANYQVVTATSAQSALDKLSKQEFQLVLTDVRMPGMTGMEFFERAKAQGFTVPFMIMTAFGQIQDAVWAMKMGAVDFLLKPFKRQTLLDAITQVQKRSEVNEEQKAASGKISSTKALPPLVGSSKKQLELKVLIEQVAKTDASVLITGESGSGKEQVAKTIHALSSRSEKPFVAINCAAIPEALLESELFGYEKGAFTGATQPKAGLFEAAEKGTIFLDEIGDMPLSLQPKLLRVLEERKVRRLGATQETAIDVRVLTATHQNLNHKVMAGQFRQDLFFRLDVVSLPVPALKERKEDIAELSNYFLERFAKLYHKTIYGLEGSVLDLLMEHAWPGNVRELSNVIERAVVLNEGGWIKVSDLPVHLQMMNSVDQSGVSSSITIPIGMSLKDVEELLIQKALEVSQGDRAQAARLLGVNERTIYRRIKSKV